MPDPSQEQIQNAERALNTLLNPIGVEAFYSDALDGVEDGIQFKDRVSGEGVLADTLIESIKGRMGDLHEIYWSDEEDHMGDLNAHRLGKVLDYISEGDTGLGGLFVSSYAVIRDDVLQDSELQGVFTEINQESKLIFGEGHEWSEILAIKTEDFSAQQQVAMAQSLNWLEKYDPGFKESLWHIKQGQDQGTIRTPVHIIYDSGSVSADNNFADEIAMNLNEPKGYVGTDGRIYQTSLNELLAHEIRHIAQKNYPDFEARRDAKDLADEAKHVAAQNLSKYLDEKWGLEGEMEQGPYFAYVNHEGHVDMQDMDLRIIQDPEYRALAQDFLQAGMNYKDKAYYYEDDAMDTVKELCATLGKPPRFHYGDNTLLSSEIGSALSGKKMLVYTESPEVIKAQGHQSWDLPDTVEMYPLLTGKLDVRRGSIDDMRHRWDDKWNPDTKNVNAKEWGVIVDAKRQMFSQNLAEITASTEEKNDLLLKKLTKEFNRSAGFDRPSDEMVKEFHSEGIQLTIK